jgi:hypothetical protein
MAAQQTINATEDEAREVAEQAREQQWSGRGFLRELFLGNLRVDWVDPYPETPMSSEFDIFFEKLRLFIDNKVDSVQIDADGKIPRDVIDGLAKLGCFGMKIDKKYGGLGLTQAEYCKAVEFLGSRDGNLVALISAHNSIGVPQPVKLFGTDHQKKTYLTQCAAGAISAFALTEPDVGSDPARLATTATRNEAGDYILTGMKLWITNATVADLMVVMARDPETKKISAFIVETDWPGITMEHRCRFMGLKALENGVVRFENVVVPKENLILGEGAGLKVALVTLNTGRLSLPAAAIGTSRSCTRISREYAAERVQWGVPVGKHEAVSHKLADMAAATYAMTAWCELANELSMREGYDIRLEAATAKEWGSTRGWDILDDTLQIRGGRGYETEASLIARGDRPEPVERMYRDSRINRIFEGSSEIMHLFMAREMVDKHLSIAGALFDKKATLGDKVKALPKIGLFYATWYPPLWWGLATPFKYGRFGSMAKHLRFAERAARRLARNVFHGMALYQAKLERKQAFLFRTVDIAMEIAVLVATVTRTQRRIDEGHADAKSAQALTDVFAANARRYIDQKFHDLWHNDDDARYKLGVEVLEGQHAWLDDPEVLTSREAFTDAGHRVIPNAAK